MKLDQGGGSCTGENVVRVRFFSIGVMKQFNEVTSPDENGDGLIALPDLGTFQAAFVGGGPQYQGDLDLSGGARIWPISRSSSATSSPRGGPTESRKTAPSSRSDPTACMV